MFDIRMTILAGFIVFAGPAQAMRGPSFEVKSIVTDADIIRNGVITFPSYGVIMQVGTALVTLYNLDNVVKNTTLRFRDAGTGEVVAWLYELKRQHPTARTALVVWLPVNNVDGIMREGSRMLSERESLIVQASIDSNGAITFQF